MRPLAKRIIAVLTLALPFAATAEPIAYASYTNALYRIDLATARGEKIGEYGEIAPRVPMLDMEGLAIAGDGTLYGVFDGYDYLVRIDPATGAATIVGPLNIPGQGTGNGGNDFDYGLAFGCDGRLWLSSDTTGKLFQVNPATGAATLVATLGHPITGLAYRDGKLYGLGGDGDQALYTIDPDAGTATRVGPVDVGGNVRFQDAGLDFDASGKLWAVIDFNPQPDNQTLVDRQELLELDPHTGAVLSQRQVGNVDRLTDFEGLAIAPPICDNPGNPGGGLQLASVPAVSHGGTGALAFALLALAAFWLRRRG